MRVIMDDREPESIEKLLRKRGVHVERKRIEVADYLVGTDICIERKTLEDFLKSIYDGRLFEQAEEMRRCCGKILIIVENTYRIDDRSRPHYLGALAYLFLKGISVIHLSDQEETVSFIAYLARKVEGDRASIIPLRKRKRPRAFEEAYSVLLSFPSIGPKSAEKLMSEFRTLKEIFDADFTKLRSIIGDSRARKFREVLNSPFIYERETRLEDQG